MKTKYNLFTAVLFISTVLLMCVTPAYGQNADRTPDQIYHHRLSQQYSAMAVLLGWGLVNMAAGTAVSLGSRDYRNFGYMTAGWGLVNAGIAAFSLYSGPPFDPASVTIADYLRDEQLFNRILAMNSGLNVAYIGVGASMARWGSSSRIRQFGSAIIFQGAFLMAFDAFLLWHSTARLGDALIFVDSLAFMDIGNRLNWSPALTMRFTL
ncbi:MAG: hypothetical protein LC662_03880 [Rhodothermaceae bacterium]|nr:hypothetical protein [Rhodothermaceae bacterium]